METQWEDGNDVPQPWEFLWIPESLYEQYVQYVTDMNNEGLGNPHPIRIRTSEEFEEWWRGLREDEREEREEEFEKGFARVQVERRAIIDRIISLIPWRDMPKIVPKENKND